MAHHLQDLETKMDSFVHLLGSLGSLPAHYKEVYIHRRQHHGTQILVSILCHILSIPFAHKNSPKIYTF